MIGEASAEALVPAPAQTVYDVLADYRTHHPRILPRQFERLDVQRGGRGEGTRIRVGMNVLGRRQRLILDVREPQPGRLLEERDIETGAVTTFTVEPEGERASRVRIGTRWPPARCASASSAA